jgi:hypothetical protein
MAHFFRTIALIGTMAVLSPVQESSDARGLDQASLEKLALSGAAQVATHALEQMADKDKTALALMIGRAMMAGDKAKP